jgi:hypothetical protein
MPVSIGKVSPRPAALAANASDADSLPASTSATSVLPSCSFGHAGRSSTASAPEPHSSTVRVRPNPVKVTVSPSRVMVTGSAAAFEGLSAPRSPRSAFTVSATGMSAAGPSAVASARVAVQYSSRSVARTVQSAGSSTAHRSTGITGRVLVACFSRANASVRAPYGAVMVVMRVVPSEWRGRV